MSVNSPTWKEKLKQLEEDTRRNKRRLEKSLSTKYGGRCDHPVQKSLWEKEQCCVLQAEVFSSSIGSILGCHARSSVVKMHSFKLSLRGHMF